MKRNVKKILLIAGAALCAMAVSSCAKPSAAQNKLLKQIFKAESSGENHNNGAAVQQFAVTLEQAKELAAAHAGVSLEDAVFSKEKLDDGVYELKFRDADGRYEYDISAADGQILEYEWDIAVENDIPGAPDDSSYMEGAVSEKQAREIALSCAGLTEEQLKFITSYVQWKQHAPYAYEVKFSESAAPYRSYRYLIDIYTGEVLGGGIKQG